MQEGTVKKPLWKKWWFWGVVIVILIIIGSSSGSDNKDQGAGTKNGEKVPAASNKVEAPEAPDLEVIEHSTESDEFTTYIVGKVKNNTDKQYGYVQVELNLYDADGAQVGSTLDNTNNLEPGGTWKFKAVAFEEFDNYKIKDVTGY